MRHKVVTDLRKARQICNDRSSAKAEAWRRYRNRVTQELEHWRKTGMLEDDEPNAEPRSSERWTDWDVC